MARKLRAEQTRATIVKAAAELFDRHGYESASLRDIVTRANVTKGAMYFHFATKEDLAHAVMDLQHNCLSRALADIDRSGYSSLEALIRGTFEMAGQTGRCSVARAGLRLAMSGVALSRPLPDPVDDWMENVAERLAAARREADLDADVEVESAARALVYFLVGSRAAGSASGSAHEMGREVAEMWRFMIRATVPEIHRRRYLELVAALE
ncbi:ScbR family autoregulator-binding transcription factor [Streptomyces sp. NPDC102270]|uniref:ScbR family autoregulator-binding transcription factor n=1 Tax=Streptomyces sp. NPDC102270 TaxID=3366150 RepID=UPI0037FC42E8